MTKQEELTGLRELKGHYQSIERLELEISKKTSDFEAELEHERDRRLPSRPKAPELPWEKIDQIFKYRYRPGSSAVFPEEKPQEYIPSVLYSVILAALQIISIIVLCAINVASAPPEVEGGPAPGAIQTIVILGCFQGPAVAFLIRFMQKRKISGIVGYILLCAFSSLILLEIFENLSNQPATALLFGFPITILMLAIVLRLWGSRRFKAKNEQVKAALAKAEQKYLKALDAWDEDCDRILDQIEKDYQPQRDKMEQTCNNLRNEITTHRTAINAATILHKEHHGDIDYIICLMETGVADSIKEALQIKRAEDQKAAHDRAQFEWNEFLRRRDEDRKWEEQRAQRERDQAQAERERERIDQAKRAADELERIRKELEND